MELTLSNFIAIGSGAIIAISSGAANYFILRKYNEIGKAWVAWQYSMAIRLFGFLIVMLSFGILLRSISEPADINRSLIILLLVVVAGMIMDLYLSVLKVRQLSLAKVPLRK